MRGFSAGVVLIALVASTSVGTQSTQAPSPQQPQQPVFRAGIELVTLDVTALDSNGRQVTDLTTADFQVEIDGDRRQVTSAEYVRSADPLRADRHAAQSGGPGRILLLVQRQGRNRAVA